MQKRKLKVIISGGGTGGHIFPAVAIAQSLMKMNPENEILFVGANGRMEMEKVPAAGFNIVGLNIAGFQRRLTFSNVLLPFKIIGSLLKARSIVKTFRPDVAVGVGGYASGPMLFAATWLKIPSLIQEQNSFAGVTNRILSKRVNRICVAYEGMEQYFPKNKIRLTGNPVRADLQYLKTKREEAFNYFGLDPEKSVVLVIGGSLGARTINLAMAEGLDRFTKEDIQIVWQTGKSGFAIANEKTSGKSNQGVRVFEFIQRMDLAYAVADVVVSRAGASSVSELALAEKAAILVPSPNVAEDHQTKNAMALVRKEAAWLVSDRDAASQLVDKTISLIKNQHSKQLLSNKIAAMALPGAAGIIAEEVYQLAGS